VGSTHEAIGPSHDSQAHRWQGSRRVHGCDDTLALPLALRNSGSRGRPTLLAGDGIQQEVLTGATRARDRPTRGVGRGTGVNGDDLVVRERRTSRGLHAGYDGMWTAKTIPGQSFFMVVVWGNFLA
jgi:hypothetical protein